MSHMKAASHISLYRSHYRVLPSDDLRPWTLRFLGSNGSNWKIHHAPSLLHAAKSTCFATLATQYIRLEQYHQTKHCTGHDLHQHRKAQLCSVQDRYGLNQCTKAPCAPTATDLGRSDQNQLKPQFSQPKPPKLPSGRPKARTARNARNARKPARSPSNGNGPRPRAQGQSRPGQENHGSF